MPKVEFRRHLQKFDKYRVVYDVNCAAYKKANNTQTHAEKKNNNVSCLIFDYIRLNL